MNSTYIKKNIKKLFKYYIDLFINIDGYLEEQVIPVLLYVGIQLLVFSFIALILNYSSEELTIFFIIYSSFMFLIKIVQTIKKYGAHAFLIYDFFRGFKIKYTKVYFEAFVLIGLLVILYFYVIQENSDPIGLVLLGLLVYKVILSILKNYLGKVLLNRKIESLYNGEYEKVYIKDSTFNNSIVLMDNLYSAMKSSIDAEYKSEKLKTELITGVSHDLKTPLTSIINYVDLIKRAKTSEQRDKYINTLSYNAKRLKSMIIDLIEASKAGSGSIDLNMQVIELNELLLQTYGQFDKEFEENNLEFELDSFKDNIFIRLDADRLNRVFENLFSNIIKYARKDSVVKVDIKKEKSFLKISFRNKSSIEYEKDIRDLQKRFIRSTNAREIEGSGLGLYIVKASIELLGGEFQVRLEKDEFVAEIFFNTRVKK